MTLWNPLSVENIVRAQCVYLSVGHKYEEIKEPSFLKKNHSQHWLETYAQEAVNAINNGRDYELIFDVAGLNRTRLFVNPPSEQVLGAEYSLVAHHMNRDPSNQSVKKLFNNITDALRKENFPAIMPQY